MSITSTRQRFSPLSREAIIAPVEFNRWLMPAAALAIHLCIGQVYALSVFKNPFITRFDAGDVSIGWVFSVAIAMLGISSAVGGTWVEKAGPRKSMVVSGCFWVLGFLVSTVGIATGQLWLLYLGYGVLGGIGLGIGYISPVSTLMKWFPDRPGLATGLAIMGFGGGALIASPVSNVLMNAYGHGDQVKGLVGTFLTMGIAYGVAIALGAYVIRLPHPDWKPKNWDPSTVAHSRLQTKANVSAAQSIRTPQFWFLWIALFTNVTAGIGILENASPMIQDFFGGKITPGAAAGFVGLLSIANMGGRFIWSTVSDYIGRKNMYIVYLGVGILMYLTIALMGGRSMVVFVLATMVIISFYGGGFAAAPAYLKDLFGVYQVGAIHGRLLTAWSAAGIAGPLIVNSVVESRKDAGSTGAGTYTLGLFIMVGVLAIGFIANLLMRPVAEKFFASKEEVEAAKVHSGKGMDGHEGVGGPVHTAVGYVLTVIVIAALAYGLIQVIIKAAALFG